MYCRRNLRSSGLLRKLFMITSPYPPRSLSLSKCQRGNFPMLLLVFLVLILFFGCNRKPSAAFDDSIGIRINRFDSIFFQWVDKDDPVSLQALISDYPQMLGLLGKSLFQTNEPDSSVFFDNLKRYYSEPTLKSLYKDALTLYATGSPATKQIEKECAYGFRRLKELFPSLQIPHIYMHVSGLQQNMIVADRLLSFSIDKYMGAGYPLYDQFFYDYQRKNMTPGCVAKDGLYAWLTSEYPYPAKERVLLDKMIYEGKILYILVQAGYGYSYQRLMQLTDSEYKWCLKYESALWKTLIERKLLNTSEEITISKYFSPAPSTFIVEDAPGNIGQFIGYRIVSRYMKQTKSTCEDLMRNNNTQEILQKSKYKP